MAEEKFPTEIPVGVATVKKQEPQLYVVQKVLSGETYLVKAKSTIELEDEFSSLYFTTNNPNNIFLEPPFEPQALLKLVQNNNVLNQCVEAMEVNVAGTGYEFVPIDKDTQPDPDEEAKAKAFFAETYPNTSFTKQERKLLRQKESIGYAFMEVLRTMDGQIQGLRNIETHNVRMVKLDAPVQVKKKITRNGKEIELTLWERERRFAQRVALKQLVYYKEFGATRNISRTTGQWETDDVKIPVEDQGTELIIFGVTPDNTTPYYIPRWINQLPSVIGSRKAEEQNLEFLDSGGLPPAIVFVQGGVLGKGVADELRMYLSGQNKDKYRAVVVEAQSSSGSMDSPGNVKVTVERFGAERANDAMFMKYDASTEEHVRIGFRLPPLFLGKAADYNFATAVTAYMVAEAQVFQPERQALDEVINMTIMKELGLKTIRFKSLPITLKDVANQMDALKAAKDISTPKSFLDEINKITGLTLELSPNPTPDTVTATATTTVDANGQPNGTQFPSGRVLPLHPQPPALMPPNRGEVQKPAFQSGVPQGALPAGQAPGKKKPTPGTPPQHPGTPLRKTAAEIVELAHDYAVSRGLVRKQQLSPERSLFLREELASLSYEDTEAFNSIVASYAFGTNTPDLQLIASTVTKSEALNPAHLTVNVEPPTVTLHQEAQPIQVTVKQDNKGKRTVKLIKDENGSLIGAEIEEKAS